MNGRQQLIAEVLDVVVHTVQEEKRQIKNKSFS
jgi:hypothetical protein